MGIGAWRISFYNAIKVICLFIICRTTFIAYANIQQPFLFDEIPTELVSENLRIEPKGNSRITQRHQCRRLAHFYFGGYKNSGKINCTFRANLSYSSGEPQFPVENIDFNISHSGDWVAVLLHINESEKVRSVLILNSQKRNFLHSWRICATSRNKEWFTKQLNEGTGFLSLLVFA